MEEKVLDYDFYFNFMRALEDVGLTGEQMGEIIRLLSDIHSVLFQLSQTWHTSWNFFISILLPITILVSFLWFFFKQFIERYR